MNVIFNDKWKMFVVTMSFIQRNARWSKFFIFHDMIKNSNREWKVFEIIKIDDDFHYVVMYENI